MAQTSSATREPSMEEILASIRRIIEDSDVTRQVSTEIGNPQTVSAGVQAEAVKVPASQNDEKRGEIAHFRRPSTTETDDNEASAQRAPLTLQAVLRGSLQDQPTDIDPALAVMRTEIHERNVAHVRIAAMNPPVPPVVTAVVSAVAAVEVPDVKVTKASEALLLQIAEQSVTSKNAPSVKQEDAQVSDKLASNLSDKPLISQAAEEQVAASFGSLSQILLEEQKRLLNEKMEAMLRPMLQEWLDSNLPPLVERLVREEIERVVRRG